MARITWPKVAKHTREKYVEGNKCKICGKTIEEGENAFRTLYNIYKHFKENHPEVLEKVKAELSTTS